MSRMRQRLVDDFIAWAPSGDAGRRGRIEVLLRRRPDPTRWRSGDVHTLLMDAVAPGQVDAWQLSERGLDTLRDFLRFLDDTGRLHPASARPAALLKELDRLTAKFPAAMADTTRWDLTKRIFTAMLRDGVRPDGDPAEVGAWAARFSARGPQERREVLGNLMEQERHATGTVLVTGDQVTMAPPGRPARTRPAPDRSGPVPTDDAALAKAVSNDGAARLRDLATLAGWVGPEGHAVDGRGEVRKADRPALLAALGLPEDGEPVLTNLWQTGLEFDVVQLVRGRAVRGPGADLVDAVLDGTAPVPAALELWTDLADVLIHPITPLHAEKGTEPLRRWLAPWAPMFLDLLGATAGPADLQALTDRLLAEQAGHLPRREPELYRRIAGTAIRNILATLARHGAVTVTGFTADPDREAAAAAAGTTTWAMAPEPGLTVELTDLGRHLMSVRSAPAGP
ncbi:hypothetical protein ACFO1B_20755 [Dactylosporangium siamense]|uniref:Uncharacterized protein n=1 Tax=Dactylosporangium siamense TaxID=685454 RepID=A0A919PN13_9ACTN|nr:hypothetical protein [Dactylosporangium siamense]GIG46834.1 hypothetical protein Dsi01nite_048750 [Dactylosporangium siamense]